MKFALKSLTATLALLAVAALTGCSALGNGAATPLQASGLIEATEISIAPELPGRVVEVFVNEGDPIQAGDQLFRLDDSLYQAQRQAASAALTLAQANLQTARSALESAQLQYDLTLSDALAAAQSTRSATWNQTKPTEFSLPNWFYSKEERMSATQAEVEAAKTALESARTNLSNVEKNAGSAQFLQAEQRLAQARIAFEIAQRVFDQAKGATDGQSLLEAAQTALDNARTELDNAQKNYNDALTTTGAQDVLKARAKVMVVQERYDAAQDAFRALQTGADSPLVAAATKTVAQASSAVDQAQAAIDQAQAELNLLDTQIGKLVVHAPIDGVVLTRSVQPGEVLQPGLTALTVAQLQHLTVTVYIPEDRYGEIHLGDQASLTLDSFPGQTFTAAVTRIADQAEFTPQNIQTKEGRQTTVYAVKLSVDNADGKLKPGMPVDVEFTK